MYCYLLIIILCSIRTTASLLLPHPVFVQHLLFDRHSSRSRDLLVKTDNFSTCMKHIFQWERKTKQSKCKNQKKYQISLRVYWQIIREHFSLDHRWQTQGPWAESGPPPCFIQPGTLFLPGSSTELLNRQLRSSYIYSSKITLGPLKATVRLMWPPENEFDTPALGPSTLLQKARFHSSLYG